MGALKDIKLSWQAFGMLCAVSLAATIFIVAGGNGSNSAEQAALAALKQPLQVAQSSASSPSGGSVPTVSKSGGGGAGGLGGGVSTAGGGGGTSPGNPASGTPVASTKTSTSTAPTKAKKHKRTPQPDAGLPKVRHVFELSLTTTGFSAAFGKHSQATYLRSLIKKGALLTNYGGFGKASELTDYLAAISGQAPNKYTTQGCPVYKSFPASAVANEKTGLVKGNGCIYPDTALTLADQAGSVGDTWGAYIQSMGTAETCQYPDPGEKQSKGIVGTEPGYSLNHNPFVYFESLLEEGACDNSDMDLSLLSKALKKPTETPNFVYVAPNECADSDPTIAPGGGTTTTTTTTTSTTTTTTATPTTTASAQTSTVAVASDSATSTAPAVGCPSADASGIPAEDAFLKAEVPKILASAAYKKDGVLIIDFAPAGDKSSSKMLRTGALVLSRYTHKGLKVGGDYGPYSLLRSVEDMLNLQPLAHAKQAGSFAKQVL